jgi:hypothetical protein
VISRQASLSGIRKGKAYGVTEAPKTLMYENSFSTYQSTTLLKFFVMLSDILGGGLPKMATCIGTITQLKISYTKSKALSSQILEWYTWTGSAFDGAQLQFIKGKGIMEHTSSMRYADIKNEATFLLSFYVRYSVIRLVRLSENIFAQSKENPSATEYIKDTHGRKK